MSSTVTQDNGILLVRTGTRFLSKERLKWGLLLGMCHTRVMPHGSVQRVRRHNYQFDGALLMIHHQRHRNS
jgi:hypothetical protein